MSTIPQLTRILINLSQSNSKVYGIVSSPKARTGTESFGPAQRMLHARRGSIAAPGDTVLDLGERYALGYFSKTANDEVFRMFLLHFEGDVMRKTEVQDPVSGFYANKGVTKVGHAYYDCQQNGYGSDVDKLKRNKYRIVTGFPLQPGDMLDQYKIVQVQTELGVTIAEAE
jgi:hypothetical protein